MIRAVIFDFNGVLVDDEHVHFTLFREILAREGIDLSEDRYHERYLGYDDRGCFEAALSDAGQVADSIRVDSLIARKAARYAEVAETGLQFFPGAAEALDALSTRVPLAICSGALRPEIEFALNRLKRRNRVSAIVSAEDTTRCKPDPEGYLQTLNILRANVADLAASECLVVEDSLAGVASAKSAGMHAVGVVHTYNADGLASAGADAVLAGLDLLTPSWIEQRFRGLAEPPAPGLLLSRDLIFTSKITGTARALGHRVLVAGDPNLAASMIVQWRPRVVFVDLSAGDLVSVPALVAYQNAAPAGTPFLAFGSHVDTAALAAAKAAGCDPVLPRSRFTTELPALIERYFGSG
jgi:HAD superfamily hydrolase (TIGR01509 family)